MKTAKEWALDTLMEMSPTELLAVERTVEAVRKEQREAIAAMIRKRAPEASCCVECAVKHAADLVEHFGTEMANECKR
jgi:hypothetical protein